MGLDWVECDEFLEQYPIDPDILIVGPSLFLQGLDQLQSPGLALATQANLRPKFCGPVPITQPQVPYKEKRV